MNMRKTSKKPTPQGEPPALWMESRSAGRGILSCGCWDGGSQWTRSKRRSGQMMSTSFSCPIKSSSTASQLMRQETPKKRRRIRKKQHSCGGGGEREPVEYHAISSVA
ncbi:hypothetical protein Nepgr_013368 [Nepenthes gracilis]|uniref:Uncharacterized protein n=1 Tax=Nepenthes gracilis TaxID=150966 RepID=A0AAD3SI01_NEPGR|nr:hypothetical protein Nepgr_013368 [Nepenthes gracilis]